jgi:predicted glycosyltransferase involved in capsule biosynthesis
LQELAEKGNYGIKIRHFIHDGKERKKKKKTQHPDRMERERERMKKGTHNRKK